MLLFINVLFSANAYQFWLTGIIEHKKNGYLANEGDCEDLANGIEWCLKNTENNVLGNNARRKVLDNYTIEIVSKQYKELYRTICK